MPRITEATVAEHRAARERALLDAAHTILLETGEPPSLSDVATRAGLARTSAYQYFGSKRELLHAMVKDIYPRWTERIREAMAAAPTDADRILAYAVANIDLVVEGAHAVGSALAALDPGEALDEQAARMHREIQEPLISALDALGVDAPDDVAGLINAVVHGATLLLETGQGRDAAVARLVAVLGPMVRELGGTGRAH
ncbi:TetR/AcrR family transcriptional regulator [Oceanitalea stevensii]|uniref:TetR/AcrR family transcriptional regulator n=1 Tax=Oceanitalea stevensii TaxID=2763072 RepID=A0ABR8Z532_9MICO|nr:TetR/AcrR family transcriptional regulator [Oceanitalea stevensii]MBD8063369.1 TetR/AcrR family transcriptional regulator [Oceanitalea stevensii]